MNNYTILPVKVKKIFLDDDDYTVFKELKFLLKNRFGSRLFEEVTRLKHTKADLNIEGDITDTLLFYFVENERHNLPHFLEKLIETLEEHRVVELVERWWPSLNEDEQVILLSKMDTYLLRDFFEQNTDCQTKFTQYVDKMHPHDVLYHAMVLSNDELGKAFSQRIMNEKLYRDAGSWDVFLRIPTFTSDNKDEWLPYALQCGVILIDSWKPLLKKTNEHDFFKLIQKDLTPRVLKHWKFELIGFYFSVHNYPNLQYLLKFKIPAIDDNLQIPVEIMTQWTLEDELGVPLSYPNHELSFEEVPLCI